MRSPSSSSFFINDEGPQRRIASRSLAVPLHIGVGGLWAASIGACLALFLLSSLRIHVDITFFRIVGWLIIQLAAAFAARYVGVFWPWAVTTILLEASFEVILGYPHIFSRPVTTCLISILPLDVAILAARLSCRVPLLMKSADTPPLRQILSNTAELVAIAVVTLFSFVVCGFIWYLFINGPYNQERFEATKWRSGISPSDRQDMECYPRAGMAEDLRRLLLRTHPSRSTVLELLGNPTRSKAEAQLSYDLGICRGFDETTFEVLFDKSDHVSEVHVQQH